MTSTGIHPDKHTKANKDSLKKQYPIIGPQGGINKTAQCASLKPKNYITVTYSVQCTETGGRLHSNSLDLTICLNMNIIIQI